MQLCRLHVKACSDLLAKLLLWYKQEQHDGDHDISQRRAQSQNPAVAALDLRLAKKEVGERTKHGDQVDPRQPADAHAALEIGAADQIPGPNPKPGRVQRESSTGITTARAVQQGSAGVRILQERGSSA
jgi:hypothetical protein